LREDSSDNIVRDFELLLKETQSLPQAQAISDADITAEIAAHRKDKLSTFIVTTLILIMAFPLTDSKANEMPPLAENKSCKELNTMLGKADFYPKIEESLKSRGFVYFDGKVIKGKTRSHHRKPDYIATRKNETVIGEIKSPQEPPTSSSWRQRQPNDTEEFAKVRQDVLTRERQGLLDPNIGGHEIIIRGQITDYANNIGKTYDLPAGVNTRKIRGGYSVPENQSKNVEAALNNCGKMSYEKINNNDGTLTYIFDL